MRDEQLYTRIEVRYNHNFVKVFDADNAQDVCSFHVTPDMSNKVIIDLITTHIQTYFTVLLFSRFNDE